MSVRMPFDRRIVSLPSRWPIALLTLLLLLLLLLPLLASGALLATGLNGARLAWTSAL